MADAESRGLEEDRGIEVAHVNPVGLLERPADGGAERRPASGRMRWAALVLVVLFAFVTLATTVASLGAYCLTTDGGDLRDLPHSSSR